VNFSRATTPEAKAAVNLFLVRHNRRGSGSDKAYVAYFAASCDNKIIAAAKFCPLHTPQAAKFFGGDDWRHAYCLQRLAADHPPANLLSEFGGWCLREMGKDPKVWYVATYAATGDFDEREPDVQKQKPHDGGIYRATNAVYCGMTEGGRIEAFIHEGKRYSMRQGPRTLRKADIPLGALTVRSQPQHRYCWAVGPTLKRFFRQRELVKRMARFKFEPVYQPRLLIKVRPGGLPLRQPGGDVRPPGR
jgi:hypothetical protein